MENKIVLNWFRFADMDFDTAEVLQTSRPEHFEIICFHCQQAVEKYLKGYLIFHGVEKPPKIHDLIELCNMCADKDDSFDSILEKCDYLTQFGVQPRYPDEIDIDEHGTKKAIQYASDIKNFTPLAAIRQEAEREKA